MYSQWTRGLIDTSSSIAHHNKAVYRDPYIYGWPIDVEMDSVYWRDQRRRTLSRPSNKDLLCGFYWTIFPLNFYICTYSGAFIINMYTAAHCLQSGSSPVDWFQQKGLAVINSRKRRLCALFFIYYYYYEREEQQHTQCVHRALACRGGRVPVSKDNRGTGLVQRPGRACLSFDKRLHSRSRQQRGGERKDFLYDRPYIPTEPVSKSEIAIYIISSFGTGKR